MSKKKVLDKFTILCWAAFTALLGHMWPEGCGWDTPVRQKGISQICISERSLCQCVGDCTGWETREDTVAVAQRDMGKVTIQQNARSLLWKHLCSFLKVSLPCFMIPLSFKSLNISHFHAQHSHPPHGSRVLFQAETPPCPLSQPMGYLPTSPAEA